MSVHRLFGPIFLALACAGPLSAAAQTAPVAPNSLAAQTESYFTAILHANAPVLSREVSNTFHLVRPDGTQLDFSAFVRDITTDFFTASNPMGVTVNIKATDAGVVRATETVDTHTWWYGAQSNDPMEGPVTAHFYATHALSWTKSADGTWLLDEDHVTSTKRS